MPEEACGVAVAVSKVADFNISAEPAARVCFVIKKDLIKTAPIPEIIATGRIDFIFELTLEDLGEIIIDLFERV